ncbi:MAG: peptidylprolyl isomerase [Fibromonadaceae bacterium]|jgi:peptidyl-prolyl cis-trans isomerase D|nr:peptidylprolyl isomerase [Fibromonadaceae bacterium]
MLTWISENAKWVIYISIAGIAAGLLFMDMSALQIDNRSPIGTVNGEKLSNDLFYMNLRRQQQAGLSEEQSAQMRDELFHSLVQQHLKQKAISNNKIQASVIEMSRDLRADLPQGIDREPSFQTNGVFDFQKYEAWLNNAASYDTPFMKQYEDMLKNVKIPEKQLRLFIGAGLQPSTLEAKYNVLNRETKFEILSAQGNAKAFEDISVSQSSIDSAFKADVDSFFVADNLAKVRYAAIPVEASAKDIESIFDYAKMLLAQIKDGADFADIARNSSEDLSSAPQGGELGGWGPRGRWVAEFDSAAFALDSGEISDLIRTQFGYHIIQSLGKRVENEEEQVAARHILLTIAATSETIDSLIEILNFVKSEVDAGKKFEDAAKTKGLNSVLSNWFKKGGEVTELGHISGLSSYAFFNPLRPRETSKVSDVLQNSKWVALFERADNLAIGSRNEEFAKPKIEHNIKTKAKANAIANYLKANISKIEEAENVSIDSVSVSFESYVPGLGYANPEIYHALTTAKEGEWSGPYTSSQTAVLIKVLSKSTPSEAELKSAIESELSMYWQYGAFSAFGDYMRNLEASANVVNNLDLYHKE